MAISRPAALRFMADPEGIRKARAALTERIGAELKLAPHRVARIVDTHLDACLSARDPESVFLIRLRAPGEGKAPKRSGSVNPRS